VSAGGSGGSRKRGATGVDLFNGKRQVDLSQEYWLDVFEPSITAWQTGQTPNPDVACNTHVKFGELARRVLGPERASAAGEQEGDVKGKGWLATGKSKYNPRQPRMQTGASNANIFLFGSYSTPLTGHYAATDRTSTGRTRLLRSADRTKDQTYYLSGCSEAQMSRVSGRVTPSPGRTRR
jgi:hypothetical protein